MDFDTNGKVAESFFDSKTKQELDLGLFVFKNLVKKVENQKNKITIAYSIVPINLL